MSTGNCHRRLFVHVLSCVLSSESLQESGRRDYEIFGARILSNHLEDDPLLYSPVVQLASIFQNVSRTFKVKHLQVAFVVRLKAGKVKTKYRPKKKTAVHYRIIDVRARHGTQRRQFAVLLSASNAPISLITRDRLTERKKERKGIEIRLPILAEGHFNRIVRH